MATSSELTDFMRFQDLLDDEEKLVIGRVARRMRETLGTACAAVPPEAEAGAGDAA